MNYNELWHRLAQVYDEGEAKAVARMVYEVRYGLSLSDILLGKDTQLSADMQKELEEIAQRLLRQEPVQYVLGVAEFCGRRFHVGPGVLIPRPETEDLCSYVKREALPFADGCSILDVGTGSGCIAVTLAADVPHAQVTAWDISETALTIAQKNARQHGVCIHFQQVDILTLPSSLSPLPSSFHLIVSNPPYILNKEKADMEQNVIDYEPDIALFVPDDDPLRYYRAIAVLGTTALMGGGALCFEINPLCAEELRDLLGKMSYHDINIYKDRYGKKRVLIAKR